MRSVRTMKSSNAASMIGFLFVAAVLVMWPCWR
jgi:hypothetical protein